MSDLLRPLLDTIETVRKRIDLARSGGGWNEAQTRASLIDPILSALGWDTSDPQFVEHESSKPDDGRADYVLKLGDNLVAIIEAKPLDHRLEGRETAQTTNYANNRGAPYAALTDGNRWLLYDIFKAAPIDQRKLLDVALSDTEPAAAALDLLALWRRNTSSRRRQGVKGPVLTEEPRPKQRESEGTGTEQLPDASAGWVSLTAISREKGQDPPSAIRFPDNAQRSTTRWNQILIFTVEWLISNGSLTEGMMPIEATAKRFLLNLKPEDSRGVSFHSPKQIQGSNIFLETGWNLADTVKRTIGVVKRCGRNPAEVGLRFDSRS